MAKAMKAARARFREFVRNAELEKNRVVPAFDAVLVKAYFPRRDGSGRGEFHFIDDVVLSKTHVSGTVNGESAACRLRMDQPIRVPITAVCDWFILPAIGTDGRGVGGFTVDVLRKTVPTEEREEYESHPPVLWYRHRQGVTAADELDQVPQCVQCGQRDLIEYSYRDGKCGCCVNGLARTECRECGLPIIRSADLSPVCFSCSQVDELEEVLTETAAPGMSLMAKVYTAGVLFVLAILSVMLPMMIFDPAGGQAKGRVLMLSILLPAWLVLAATVVNNIRQKRLSGIATILQAIALCATFIGVPVAVLGILTLSNQPKDEDEDE